MINYVIVLDYQRAGKFANFKGDGIKKRHNPLSESPETVAIHNPAKKLDHSKKRNYFSKIL